MAMNYDAGGQLVFLISQPRSGSTLLQRILSCCPDIYTQSEDWLLLRPLWGMATNEPLGTAPYDSLIAHQALTSFISRLPRGMTDYYRACGCMYGALYGSILEATGKRLYLDKTPRYYSIWEEIAEVFPEARFIFLARHPVAVMHSLLDTYHAWDWTRLYLHKDDLMSAPKQMLKARALLGQRLCWVNYEKLVADSSNETKRICEFIGVKFDESMVADYHENMERWELGDPTAIYARKGIDGESVNSWRNRVRDAQFKKAASGYLAALGEDVLAGLGYQLADEQDWLRKRPSRVWNDLFTAKWDTLMQGTGVSRWKIRLARRIRLQG